MLDTTPYPDGITPLHVERGTQMRQIVEHDIGKRGLTVEQSIESLSRYLGVDVETVKLGISISNEFNPRG